MNPHSVPSNVLFGLTLVNGVFPMFFPEKYADVSLIELIAIRRSVLISPFGSFLISNAKGIDIRI